MYYEWQSSLPQLLMHAYCKQYILRTYGCMDKPMPTVLCLGTLVPRQNPRNCVWPSIMPTTILLHVGSVRVLPLNWTCIYDASYIQGHSYAFKNGISSELPQGEPPSSTKPPQSLLVATSPKSPFWKSWLQTWHWRYCQDVIFKYWDQHWGEYMYFISVQL